MPRAAYIDGYRPFDFKDFSAGLNLRDKADVVTEREAIDLLNVTFTERGAIRQRDGFTDFTPTDLTNRADSLSPFYTVAGLRQLVIGAGTRIDVVDQFGLPVASRSGLNGGPYSFARFADPAHEYLYAGNGKDSLQRWDGAVWTGGDALATVNGAAAQAMPRAGSICVTASVSGATSGSNASNRLVATAFGTTTNGGPGGFASTPSRVFFSNPGQPEIWETDGFAGTPGSVLPRGRNYVDLTPGDGERIMAAVTWRELVFVFKETKFFVLWGEGQNADGTPTFQFREIVNSVGLAAPLGVSAGRDGVYFMNRRGVYRTSGGDPVLLSDVISPLWTGDPDIYYTGAPINLAAYASARLLWQQEQVFVAVPTGVSTVNDRMLLYDTQHQWWTVYDIAASALASFRRVDRMELHHGYALGPQRIGRRNYGGATDRDAPIRSFWRSGWGDYGSSQVKTIRETKVWGAGIVNVSLSTDFNRSQLATLRTVFSNPQRTYDELNASYPSYDVVNATFASYDAMASGAWPGIQQVSDAQVRYATRATVFSLQFSNHSDAPTWSVHRFARQLREIREPSALR